MIFGEPSRGDPALSGGTWYCPGHKDGNADTEDLRQAVTFYRSLVVALLADDGDGGHQRRRQRAGQHADEGTGDQA